MKNTVVLLAAILAIAVMQVNALAHGHDGTILTGSIAAIAVIAGYVGKSMVTRGERREQKRLRSRKMRVTGAGVRRLQEIIMRRAHAAQEWEEGIPGEKRTPRQEGQ